MEIQKSKVELIKIIVEIIKHNDGELSIETIKDYYNKLAKHIAIAPL